MLMIICFLLMIIPYPGTPSWESIDDDYTTGGALVDIDLDGDVDLVTGNGNDMDRDPNRVYYNTGNNLETIASWVSSDSGYNAHISLGDINYDGYPDLAVANYGDPGTPQYNKIYLNIGGQFENTASWRPRDLGNSFSCAFGDVDGDGNLDLAVACGEDYTNQPQRAKLYLNNNGIIDTIPIWQSNLQSYFYDVAWVDIDLDGDLDLSLAGMHVKNYIYLNADGVLGSMPYWQSAASLGTIKIAFGDVDNDGDQDMVCANNAQTGGTSNCQLYLNNGVTLDSFPIWSSQTTQYYSCVALGDVDRDDDLDLAAGGWWESVKVFENIGGIFPTTPSWSWRPSTVSHLVCEHVCFGDVDNTIPAAVVDEVHIVDPSRRVFYLDNRWIKNVTRVRRNGGELGRDEFCFSYTDGWVSVNDLFTQSETLWVSYTYALDLDLLVTNWHSSRGNFLFLNTTGSGLAELEPGTKHAIPIVSPGRGNIALPVSIRNPRVKVYDKMGALVAEHFEHKLTLSESGVYFVRVYEGRNLILSTKIVVVR